MFRESRRGGGRRESGLGGLSLLLRMYGTPYGTPYVWYSVWYSVQFHTIVWRGHLRCQTSDLAASPACRAGPLEHGAYSTVCVCTYSVLRTPYSVEVRESQTPPSLPPPGRAPGSTGPGEYCNNDAAASMAGRGGGADACWCMLVHVLRRAPFAALAGDRPPETASTYQPWGDDFWGAADRRRARTASVAMGDEPRFACRRAQHPTPVRFHERPRSLPGATPAPGATLGPSPPPQCSRPVLLFCYVFYSYY